MLIYVYSFLDIRRLNVLACVSALMHFSDFVFHFDYDMKMAQSNSFSQDIFVKPVQKIQELFS